MSLCHYVVFSFWHLQLDNCRHLWWHLLSQCILAKQCRSCFNLTISRRFEILIKTCSYNVNKLSRFFFAISKLVENYNYLCFNLTFFSLGSFGSCKCSSNITWAISFKWPNIGPLSSFTKSSFNSTFFQKSSFALSSTLRRTMQFLISVWSE